MYKILFILDTPHQQIQASIPINSLQKGTDGINQQINFVNNISPIPRYQSQISTVGNAFPITNSSDIMAINNINSFQVTKAFTPTNSFANQGNYFITQTGSFVQNNNTNSDPNSINTSRLNMVGNAIMKTDDNFQVNNNIRDGVQQQTQYQNQFKVQTVQEFNSPNSITKQDKQQSWSAKRLLAQIKNEDDLQFQREMIQADKYLSKVYASKLGLNNSLEELPQNFGAILAKRTSPPLKGKNYSARGYIPINNSNNSHNQSGQFHLKSLQSQNNLAGGIVNTLGNNNSSAETIQNSNSSMYQYNLTNQNQQYQKGNLSNSFQKQSQYSIFQNPFSTKKDNSKNKNGFGAIQKQEKSMKESKAYLQAMKALQDRIKELEKQISIFNEEEVRLTIESQYQQNLEESNQTIESMNLKNNQQEEYISSLLIQIEQYKNAIYQKEREFAFSREEWLKGNHERNHIIESHIQKQAQLNSQLQQELERNNQMQIELSETQQKWQLIHQEQLLIEAQKFELLQNELDDEKFQHNELKDLCVKGSEEIETLLAQNKTLDQKLQFKEKEFDEYRIQFNKEKMDLLKDQIQKQNEYLQKIEEQMKITYEQKSIKLETELSSSRLIENQLRNEIQDLKKSVSQRSIDQQNQSSLQLQQCNQQNQHNQQAGNIEQNQQNSPSQDINQLNKQNNNQNSYRSQQQLNSNKQENGQNCSQSELEKYLLPSTPNNNNNILNGSQGNQSQNHIQNNYLNSEQNNFQNSSLNNIKNKYLNLNQNNGQSNNQNSDLNNNNNQNKQTNTISNEQINDQNKLKNINQNIIRQINQNNLQNIIDSNIYNQMIQQQIHARVNSHQVNDIEHLSLQEESDLLNFDYDELQQSRLNSKNSPAVSFLKQGQIQLQSSLDSPLKRISSPQQFVSSSLQFTKQFQNQQSLQNSLRASKQFMQAQHQQSGDHILQNVVQPSPFFASSYHNSFQNSQLSPDFKTRNTGQFYSERAQIYKQINKGQARDHQNFQDQIPQTQMSFNDKSEINDQQLIQQQHEIASLKHQMYAQQLQIDQQQQQMSSQQNQIIQQQQIIQMRENEQDNMNKQLPQTQKINQIMHNQERQLYSNQDFEQMYPSIYLKYSDSINNELQYKKQVIAPQLKRSKSSNQSLHKQQQQLQHRMRDNIPQSMDDFNLDLNYPSNIIGNELIRDIFEAESEQKLLNQRYEVLLGESRTEENSKKKSEIRKELISISEKIKNLNEKLYVLRKKEKFIITQQYQKKIQNNENQIEKQTQIKQLQRLNGKDKSFPVNN